jgi:hypothetical protein
MVLVRACTFCVRTALTRRIYWPRAHSHVAYPDVRVYTLNKRRTINAAWRHYRSVVNVEGGFWLGSGEHNCVSPAPVLTWVTSGIAEWL